MTSIEKKIEKLQSVEHLILASPDGITRAEISRRLSISRATAGRYIDELPVAEDPETRKLSMDKSLYLNNIKLTLHEVMALYLSSALMAKAMDRRNLHAASVLRKLGTAVERVAPVFAERMRDEAGILDGPERTEDKAFSTILDTLTTAWADGRKVSLLYSGQHKTAPSSYVFAPYVVLPNAVGRTFHTAGKCDGENFVRVFRIDRVKMCTLSGDRFTPPEDFSAETHFKNAWGVWLGESKKGVEVTIRFNPEVAERVLETKWHANERTQKQPDGSVIWKALIAEPTEMLPWIRGWGANAEVFAPEELRQTIAAEAGNMAALYG